MIQGQEYAWEDINVTVKGQTQPMDGVVDIKYKTKREFKSVHARGKDPYRIQPGKKEYDGSIKLLQSEVERLLRSAPVGGDLTDLPPVEISVAYTPEDGGQETTDVLQNVRFNEFEKGMGSEDTHAEIEIPLTIGKILYNV